MSRAWLNAIGLLAFVGSLLAPSFAWARGCHEVSDIVGEEHCSRYGSNWSVERQGPIMFRFGMRYSDLSISGATFEEVRRGTRGYRAYSFSGKALGVPSVSVLGLDGGLGVFVVGQLYIALEGGLAFGSVSPAAFTTTNGVTLSGDSGLDVSVFHFGAPIGYRIPFGRFAFRAEVMSGIVIPTIGMKATAPSSATSSAQLVNGLIEPRVAAELWLTQHLALGVYAGTNVIDGIGKSPSIGLSLSWHHRAFDGA